MVKPYQLDPDRKINISSAVFITLLGAVAAASVAWSTVRKTPDQIAALDTRLTANEHAVAALTTDIAVIKNDSGWVRGYLERQRPVFGQPSTAAATPSRTSP